MSSSSSAVALKRLDMPEAPISLKPFRSAAGQTLFCCLLLTLAVLTCYGPVTRNGFLNYDDDQYVVDNPHIAAGITWATVKWAFTTFYQGNWAPLSWMSHALDRKFFGLNPAGHHYINVLLHAANALLLFLFLQSITRSRWRSIVVATLFAVHPVNVESVAWAAERKNVLSMLFFLLALHAYSWYTRQPGILRYVPVFLMFAFGLLSKSQIITFPFLLWLLDYWPLRRIDSFNFNFTFGAGSEMDPGGYLPRVSMKWAVLEKVPLLLLSAASAVITMAAERAGSAIRDVQYSPLMRVETALISYVRYLGKAVWPAKLAALYPHPTILYPVWRVSASAALLAFISVIVTLAALRDRNRRYLFVGWFWFLGTLVPMIGLMQVGEHAMADRFAYIPFIGLFLMVTWLASDWLRARRLSSRWVAIPTVLCLFALGTLAYRQVGYWRDIPTFWTHIIAVTEPNYVAETNLGQYLFSSDRFDEAAAHFRSALAARPDGLTARLDLGVYEDQQGNYAAAIEDYQAVADRAGELGMRAMAYGNLGFVYRQIRQSLKAKRCFEVSLQADPARARARIGLGLLAQENGEADEAVRQFTLAAAARPSEVVDLLLARALQQNGHADEAKAIYERLAQSSNLAAAEKEVQSLLLRK